MSQSAATDAKSKLINRGVFPKGKTLHVTLHSIRKITVPAFLLILKITTIPSMQLSWIRERPGVSIFQLCMDSGAGGV